jgi:hypothetical protein
MGKRPCIATTGPQANFIFSSQADHISFAAVIDVFPANGYIISIIVVHQGRASKIKLRSSIWKNLTTFIKKGSLKAYVDQYWIFTISEPHTARLDGSCPSAKPNPGSQGPLDMEINRADFDGCWLYDKPHNNVC